MAAIPMRTTTAMPVLRAAPLFGTKRLCVLEGNDSLKDLSERGSETVGHPAQYGNAQFQLRPSIILTVPFEDVLGTLLGIERLTIPVKNPHWKSPNEGEIHVRGFGPPPISNTGPQGNTMIRIATTVPKPIRVALLISLLMMCGDRLNHYCHQPVLTTWWAMVEGVNRRVVSHSGCLEPSLGLSPSLFQQS
jgi:hypothetical protein